MSTESVMPSNHLILCCPLLFLPSIIPSIRVFSNESALCIRWPKYWSFSLSISLSNEHLGLISFRVDWFDLLVVQGTLKADVAKLIKAHSTSTRLPPPRLTVYLHRGTQLNQGGAQDSGGQGFGNSGLCLPALGATQAPHHPGTVGPSLPGSSGCSRLPRAGAPSALLWVPGWRNAL